MLPNIMSVDAGGTVRGLRAGRVQVVATWHDSQGFSLVMVLEPVAIGSPWRYCLDPRAFRTERPGHCERVRVTARWCSLAPADASRSCTDQTVPVRFIS